jgi:hypothetical protein
VVSTAQSYEAYVSRLIARGAAWDAAGSPAHPFQSDEHPSVDHCRVCGGGRHGYQHH